MTHRCQFSIFYFIINAFREWLDEWWDQDLGRDKAINCTSHSQIALSFPEKFWKFAKNNLFHDSRREKKWTKFQAMKFHNLIFARLPQNFHTCEPWTSINKSLHNTRAFDKKNYVCFGLFPIQNAIIIANNLSRICYLMKTSARLSFTHAK